MKDITLVEYLKLAFKHKLFLKRSWRISVLVNLLEYKTFEDLYVYIDKTNYVFNFEGEVYRILDCPITRSPLKWEDKLTVPKDFLPNINEKINTTFGRLLLNIFGFTLEFYDLIPYYNEEFNVGVFHKAYFKLYTEGKISTTKQLLNCINRLHMLEADAELGVPCASIETFTTHPDMAKKRKEILEKYKDSLNEPVTQAKIDKELTTLDREYIKGTQAEKFLISNKMFDVVRKKTRIAYGSETNMEGKATDFIAKPLEDGVDIAQMPAWVDASRSGSYSRGSLTGLGGYEVKKDERAYGHLEVVKGDCKTKKGLQIDISTTNSNMLIGMRLLKDNVPLTAEMLTKNIGKTLVIRAPSQCALKRDYCEYCMGVVAAKEPYGIPGGAMVLDSNSMGAAMAAAHGKSSKINKLDMKLISR